MWDLIRGLLTDLVLRMVVLTVGTKYTLAVCKERDFMWSDWTPRSHHGVSRGRFLLNPCWQSDIVENDATTTDGYAYRFYEY